MFCRICGTELPNESRFCLKCGNETKVIDSFTETDNSIEVNYGTVKLKSLRVLSIIGFFVFVAGFSLASKIDNLENHYRPFEDIFMYFGYALAFAIVALVKGNKYKLKATKVMSIIGIILFSYSLLIFSSLSSKSDIIGSKPFIFIGMSYAFALSIVSFIQAGKKLRS